MDQQNEEYERIFNLYDGRIKNKMRLQECENYIWISNDSNINQQRNEIEEYERENKEY